MPCEALLSAWPPVRKHSVGSCRDVMGCSWEGAGADAEDEGASGSEGPCLPLPSLSSVKTVSG